MFPPFTAALLLLLELSLYSKAAIVSTTSDPGIFQLVTPTAHASLVPDTALSQLSADAASFYGSYIKADTFNLVSAEILAVVAASTTAGYGVSLIAQEPVLDALYFDAPTSLLDNPTAYLSRLSSAASLWPFSSTLMSQASGLLLGYESLVSQDILNVTATQAIVTPGVSIKVGPAATAVSTTATTGSQTKTGATGTSTTAHSTSSSKALGVPVATANSHLMYSGVVAAAGIFGMVLL